MFTLLTINLSHMPSLQVSCSWPVCILFVCPVCISFTRLVYVLFMHILFVHPVLLSFASLSCLFCLHLPFHNTFVLRQLLYV